MPGRVVVIGASSLVGRALLPALQARPDCALTLISRQRPPSEPSHAHWIQAQTADDLAMHADALKDAVWICLAPIWVLADYLPAIARCAPRRVIALSSTSRFSKTESADPAERALAQRLAQGEARLQSWAAARAVDWIILQPTLIHGFGADANVAGIARFIRRFGFFPLLGAGRGLRRPVHACEVAQAVLAAVQREQAGQTAYILSGGEVLSYRSMVERVFAALGLPVRIVPVPRWALRCALVLLHALGRARNLSIGMADRMEQDLDFPHTLAQTHLGFCPGPFVLDINGSAVGSDPAGSCQK